jgi:hypothetical protein
MLAALVAIVAGPVRRFVPQWQPLPLVGLCFLIAVETMLISRLSHGGRLGLNERLRYLAPELLLLAVAMRAVAALSLPHGDLAQVARGWLYDPLSAFDAVFLLHLAAGVLVGVLAHGATYEILTLEFRQGDDVAIRGEGGERYAAFLADERAEALRRISTRFAIGGVALIFALSLEVADFGRLGGPPFPMSQLTVIGALTYLVAGFLLHSRARLAVLQARWKLEGATIGPLVGRRWSQGALLLVGGVLAAAALLPRAYGMGLLDALRTLLAALGYGLAVLGYLITYLFGALLLLPALLLSLLMPTGGADLPPAAPPPLAIPPPPPAMEREPRLWPALIFWLCLLILAGYAGLVTLRRHPRLLRGLRIWLAIVRREIARFWRGAEQWVALVVEAARDRLAVQDEPVGARVRGRPRRLGPTDQIIRYYQAIVEIAAEAGHARKPGQTPDEYRRDLGAQLPGAAPDLDQLTETFTRARYAPRPATNADAHQARGLWARLRRLLRGR